MLEGRRDGSRRLLAVVLAALASAPATVAADVDARKLTPLIRSGQLLGALQGPDGRLPLLVRLPAGVQPADRGMLEVAPGVGSIWLEPDALEAFTQSNPDLRVTTAPPRHTLINVSPKWHRADVFRAETGLTGAGVIVGVVDTGIDASHLDFRNADGSTRVAWAMLRAEPQGLQPELEARYGCSDPNQSPCVIMSSADIDIALRFAPDGAPRDGDGHGTHITSIAAGNGGLSQKVAPQYVGMAPEATIISVAPSGGRGFADPDILRGVQFIFDRADEMGLPAVVNVSLGSDFGPHDGTSDLEAGLAAMVGPDKPGRVIVVAAGNSGALYASTKDGEGPYGIHTEAHVSPNAVTRVPIVQPGVENALEVHGTEKVDGAGFVWVTFRPGDDVSVGLEGPDGIKVGLTGPGNEKGDNKSSVVAAVVNNLVNGKTSLNEATNSAVVFWDGEWSPGDFTLLLSGRGDAQLWVTGTGGAAPGLSAGLNFSRGLRQGTISVPASHPDLLSVGCTINRIRWRPLGSFDLLQLTTFGTQSPPIDDSICYFSGAGPNATGAMKPELLAPGAFVAAAMSRDADPRADASSMFYQPFCGDGIATCLMVNETHAITSGTSMSAPHVAGGVALLLERDPSLTQSQVRDILQAGARRPVGEVPFDFQQGPGELDMMGALQVLDEQLDTAQAFVPASYYVLASPYVRPDPSWAVEGTIQLRHEDGTIVTSASASDLSVQLDGGLLVRAVERVRAGLFRFAISAPRGSGGTTLKIDVLYRGQSLGARKLPVGVDAFAAGGGVDAVGGCEISQQRGGMGAWWLMPLAMLGLLWRRRSSVAG